MPAFDPVRDAVLNSPVAQPKTLPFRLDLPTASFPNPSPVSSSSESAVSAQSPLTRRATHLSVLLNDDPPPEPSSSQSLFTPTTPRAPVSFSHLLHPDDPSPSINEQLANATPLRRRSSVADSGYFPPTRSPLAFPGSSNATQDASHTHPSPSSVQRSGLALPGGFASPSPEGAAPGSRPSTATAPSPADADKPLPRRRSSGASDFHRDGSSYFAPATSSPLALPGNQQMAPRSPPPPAPPPLASSADRDSPTRSGAAAPSSPTASISRPSTSGSASLTRPESPKSIKTRVYKEMPPPPAPPAAASAGTTTAGGATSSPKPSSRRSSLSEESAPQKSQPTMTFPRSTVPYKPHNRISTPATVLVPLTQAEIEHYKNFTGGIGTQLLKRKRKGEDTEEQGPEDRPAKRVKDVVAEHYNARPEVGLAQRRDSPIIGLKNFNNWVKSVLIISQAHPIVSRSEFTGTLFGSAGGSMRGPARGAGKVLEIGCGKGGDLFKWSKAKIKDFVGIDIASVSIDQARFRYTQLRGPKYTAYFTAADCYSRLLSEVLPENVLPPMAAPFDVVSLQFCMHYAFESEEKVRTMLTNVTKWMKPGGRFIGTVPNDRWLMERLDAVPSDATELSFGNSVYKVRFDQREERPLYGFRYHFYLKDAVEDVPEYVVNWENFVKLAAEYDLDLIYEKEFHEVYAENEEHPEFGPMLQHMKVVDSNGESQMDEDQWEAANIYIAFAFQKRDR